MEHRWNKRCRVSFAVTVYQRDTAFRDYQVTDISPYGMCLQGSGTDFQDRSIVEVELKANGDQWHGQDRIQAIVVHNSSGGVGLMFLDRLDFNLLEIPLNP